MQSSGWLPDNSFIYGVETAVEILQRRMKLDGQVVSRNSLKQQ